MRNVRIICGVYGYRPNGGESVKTRRHGDTCELPDAEAERLVMLKVAEYVDATPEEGVRGVATAGESENASETGGNTPDVNSGSEGTDEAVAYLEVGDLMSMTKANMEKLAAEMGVDIAGAKTKAEIAVRIAAVPVEPVDEDAPPKLGAEVPQA